MWWSGGGQALALVGVDPIGEGVGVGQVLRIVLMFLQALALVGVRVPSLALEKVLAFLQALALVSVGEGVRVPSLALVGVDPIGEGVGVGQVLRIVLMFLQALALVGVDPIGEGVGVGQALVVAFLTKKKVQKRVVCTSFVPLCFLHLAKVLVLLNHSNIVKSEYRK